MKNKLFLTSGSAVWQSLLSLSSGKKTLKLIAATALIAACGAISSQAARITWDFNDGTMQGWTNKMKSTSPALSFAPVYSFYGWSSSGDDGSAQPELGAFFLGQDSFVQNTHQTLWAESPAFTLDGTGDITFLAMGATNGGNLTNASYIPATSSAAGMCAVALRRDDGTFVITKHVTGDPGATFNQYTITAAELAPYLYDGHSYTIDVLDFYSGPVCSIIAVDNVSVPGVGTDMINFNFNDGTMQGWTNVMVSTAAAGYYDLSFGPAQQTGHDGWGGGTNASWTVAGVTANNGANAAVIPASMGAYFLGEVPFQAQLGSTIWSNWPAASSGVQQTIMVQSPAFKINNSGPLTYVGCGTSLTYTNGDTIPMTTVSALPALGGTWGPQSDAPDLSDTTKGSCKVGLLRNDGVFVLTKDFDQPAWATYTFTAAELAPFVNDGHTYTLNVVDFLSGQSAWCAIDEVSIPGYLETRNSQQINNFGTMADRTFGLSDIMAEFPTLAASSGMPVKFSVASGPATVSGSMVNVTNFGTVTITATQLGNYQYLPATPVTRSFNVIAGKGSQLITFGSLTNQTFGTNFTLTATASSGLPVTYTLSGAATLNGNVVNCNYGDGTVVVTAHQGGSANYNAAPDVSRIFQVTVPAALPWLGWQFNDGTMQGWTNRMVSTAAAGYVDLAFGPVTNAHGFPTIVNGVDQDNVGAYLMGEVPVANDSLAVNWGAWPAQGSGVHQTLWVQSPAFYFAELPEWGSWLNTAGSIGATNPATGLRNLSLTNYTAATIPRIAGNWGPEHGNVTGNEGSVYVALMRDDGVIVSSKCVHQGNGSDPAPNYTHRYTDFWTTRFSQDETAPYIHDGHTYTVNVIDMLAGPDAWIIFDNVYFPGTVMTGTETIGWNFNDGTMQGWVNKSSSKASDGYYDLAFAPVTSEQGITVPAGTYFLGETPGTNDSVTVNWANWPNANCGIHKTLWAESPAFVLTSSNAITFIAAGCPGAINPANGTNGWRDIPLTTIPDVAGTWGPESGNAVGTEGTCAIGLRRDDGTFVLTRHVNGNNLDPYSFPADEVAPFVNDGHSYTLDIVDALGGTGAWIAIDEVHVPGKLAPITTAPKLSVTLSADKTQVVLTWTPTVAGQTCTVLTSADVNAPISNWTSVATVTTTAGTTTKQLNLTGTRTFYRIKY